MIHLMELGLHRSPKELKIKVYETIKTLAPFSSGILLFYGLCGNVLGDVEKDFERSSTSCPVRILKDKDHRIVDDCIGATVGGVNNYLRILKSVSDAGTYLFTPMYSKGWRELLDLNKLNKDPSKALQLMKKTHEMIGYKKLLRLIPVLNTLKTSMLFKNLRLFDFEILEDDGNQKILKIAITNSKRNFRKIKS